MTFVFRVLPKLVMIPIGVYFYFYFKRMLQYFHRDVSKIYIKGLIAILCICFVYPATNFFKFWAVIVLHLFVFGVVVDIVYFFLKKYPRIYQSGIIPILCVCLVIVYGYFNMLNIHETHYTVRTQKYLSQDYRIAFLSDLHFPTTLTKQELKEYCREISALKPDIVILGGDIVDEKTSYQDMKLTFEMLSQIKNRYGIYYVYGNHDQALYVQKPSFTADQLKETMTSNHICLLEDQYTTIQNELTLLGRANRNMNRKTSEQLIKGINKENLLMIVDHQPVDLSINDKLGFDLQLSGHTHGGQMFPVGLMSDLLGFGEMNYGYRQLNSMQVIVSSGMAGWGYPLRTGSKSEYVIIDVIRK